MGGIRSRCGPDLVTHLAGGRHGERHRLSGTRGHTRDGPGGAGQAIAADRFTRRGRSSWPMRKNSFVRRRPGRPVDPVRVCGDHLTPGAVGVRPLPSDFRTAQITVDGATIHVRVGGQGPAVVMLRGFADTGDMWAPLAGALARERTVVVPDLRGMGLSSHPEGGYDKKTQGADVARVLDTLGIEKTDVVGRI